MLGEYFVLNVQDKRLKIYELGGLPSNSDRGIYIKLGKAGHNKVKILR